MALPGANELRWMCWDWNSVNDDQHIYVEKSEVLMDLYGRVKNVLQIRLM